MRGRTSCAWRTPSINRPLRQLLVGELRLVRRDGCAFDGRVRRLLRRHGRHGGRVHGLMRRDGRAFDGRGRVLLPRRVLSSRGEETGGRVCAGVHPVDRTLTGAVADGKVRGP